MRLWTIQSRERWEELDTVGVLGGPRGGEPEVLDVEAYRWMAAQMARRLGPPPVTTSLPLWAWHRWQADRPRPDLRARGHLPTGSQGVRIEVVVRNGSALLSDFESWHAVLNRQYLATSEADLEAFENEVARGSAPNLSPGQCHRPMEASWERIFELSAASFYAAPDPEDRPVQATLWEIRRDQVRTFTPFVAR